MASEKKGTADGGAPLARLQALAAGGPYKDPWLTERSQLAIELMVRRRDLLAALNREQVLTEKGYTAFAAQALGQDALDAFYKGGAPGLGRWNREQRAAMVAKLQEGA